VAKKRGRTKTATDEEEAQPPKKKPATKKTAGRPSATSQRRDEEDEAEDEVKVRKKRKLKIFNSSQPSAFTWTFDGDKVCGRGSPSSRMFQIDDLNLGDEWVGYPD
jgi:hypothetical protein